MTQKTPAGNFIALFAAQIVAQLAGLVTTAWLARALQPEAFGIVGFGAAVLSYFGLFVVFGTDKLVMREIARDPEAAARELPRLVGLRIALLLVAAAAYLTVVELIGQPDLVKTVMRIQALGLVASAISLDFVYQGLQRMRVIAVRQAASSVLALTLTVLLVRSEASVLIAAAIPNAVLILTGAWLAWRVQKTTGALAVSIDIPAWRAMLRRALPMAVTAAMAAIYLNIDIIMLGFMDTQRTVGLYSGAGRLYAISVVVGGLLVAAFLPSLAATFGDGDGMRTRFREFAFAMLYLGMPLVAAMGVFSPAAVRLLLGDGFAAAAPAVSLLMVAAGLNYANQMASATLLSWYRETAQMYAQGIGAGLNVGLNLVLIPRYGMIGAAAATVASEAAVFAIQTLRLWTGFRITLFRPLLQTASVAVAAILAVWGLGRLSGGLDFASPVLHLTVNGGLFAVFYVGFLWASGIADPRRIGTLFAAHRSGG